MFEGMKIGMPKEFFEGLASETGDLILGRDQTLKKLGCEVREIRLPHTPYAVACYYIIATAEASSNLARYDGVRYTTPVAESADTLADMYRMTRDEGFGAECKRRIMLGTYVLSAGYYDAYYLKAQKVRALIARITRKRLSRWTRSSVRCRPFPAFKLGEKVDDPAAMYLSDIYTITGTLAGIPVHERALRQDAGRAARGIADLSESLQRNGNVSSGGRISRQACYVTESSITERDTLRCTS